MSIGLVGRKCGMTRVFTEDGSIPVTVVEVLPNRITQIKKKETDQYSAVQVTTGSRRQSRVLKPNAGVYAKANTGAGRGSWEFAVDSDQALEGLTVGGEIKLDRLAVGQYVDVSGLTKGKGFAGTIKRHHFSAQDMSHGNSVSHRVPGSIGQRQTPGKVFKGKKMCGHLGQANRTIQSLYIVRLDLEKNLVLVSGAIPGAPGSDVIIRPAVKIPAGKIKALKGEAK